MASTLAVVSLVNLLGWLSGSLLLLTWFLVVNLAAVHHGLLHRSQNRRLSELQIVGDWSQAMRQDAARGKRYVMILLWDNMLLEGYELYIITTHSAKHMCVISCDQQFHQLIPPASSNSYVYVYIYICIYIYIHNIIQYYAICQNISNFSHFCYDMLWPPSAPRCSTSLSVAWPWTVDSCGTYIAGYYWFAMLCHFRKVTKYLIPSSRISQRLSKWHCFLVFSDLFQKVQRNCDEMALLSCWVVPSTSLYHVCRNSNSVANVHQLSNIMQPTMYCTSTSEY